MRASPAPRRDGAAGGAPAPARSTALLLCLKTDVRTGAISHAATQHKGAETTAQHARARTKPSTKGTRAMAEGEAN